MKYFNEYEDALTKQIADDAYSQDEIIFSLNDLENLKIGKVLYHNFDDKSCIIRVKM